MDRRSESHIVAVISFTTKKGNEDGIMPWTVFGKSKDDPFRALQIAKDFILKYRGSGIDICISEIRFHFCARIKEGTFNVHRY